MLLLCCHRWHVWWLWLLSVARKLLWVAWRFLGYLFSIDMRKNIKISFFGLFILVAKQVMFIKFLLLRPVFCWVDWVHEAKLVFRMLLTLPEMYARSFQCFLKFICCFLCLFGSSSDLFALSSIKHKRRLLFGPVNIAYLLGWYHSRWWRWRWSRYWSLTLISLLINLLRLLLVLSRRFLSTNLLEVDGSRSRRGFQSMRFRLWWFFKIKSALKVNSKLL